MTDDAPHPRAPVNQFSASIYPTAAAPSPGRRRSHPRPESAPLPGRKRRAGNGKFLAGNGACRGWRWPHPWPEAAPARKRRVPSAGDGPAIGRKRPDPPGHPPGLPDDAPHPRAPVNIFFASIHPSAAAPSPRPEAAPLPGRKRRAGPIPRRKRRILRPETARSSPETAHTPAGDGPALCRKRFRPLSPAGNGASPGRKRPRFPRYCRAAEHPPRAAGGSPAPDNSLPFPGRRRRGTCPARLRPSGHFFTRGTAHRRPASPGRPG